MQPIDPGRGPAVLPRGHRARPVLGTVVTLALAGVCWWTSASAEMTGVGQHEALARRVLLGVAVGLALLGVLGLLTVLLGGRRVPRWRVDHEGIAVWHRWGSAEIPWSHVVGVGVGYERPPAISTAVRPKEDLAVEVFVRDPDPAAVFPRVGPLLWTEPAPRAGLPDQRVRVVGIETGLEQRLGAAVGTVRPDLWVGAYQRQWNVVPGA